MYVTLEDIKSVEWSRSYLWEVQFLDGPLLEAEMPSNFQSWFPAIDVQENIATLTEMNIQAYISTYAVPQATTMFDVTITFVDDSDNSLSAWLVDWINFITESEDGTIKLLDESCLVMMVNKLKPDREVLTSNAYLVFPTGAIYYSGNSESGPVQYQVKFIVAGRTVADTLESARSSGGSVSNVYGFKRWISNL